MDTVLKVLAFIGYIACLIVSLIMRNHHKDNDATWYLVFSAMFLMQMYHI